MQPVNVTLGLSSIVSGVLVFLLSLPLLKDKIGPNRWYGVRIRKAFESRENWFKLQRFGARKLILWSGVLVACGAVALLVPFNANQTVPLLAFSFAPLIVLLVLFLQILRYAKTL
jgi:hypothetical protein